MTVPDPYQAALASRLIVPEGGGHVDVFFEPVWSVWRFRAVAAGGEITVTGKPYYSRWSARRAARRFRPGWAIVNI